ncbi:MAG: ATP-binding protein [Parcubacteria group bacterium]|jgi:signal transduction histidine kinase
MKNDLQEKDISNSGVFQKSVFLLFEKVIKPKSKSEDSRRHEFILNVLLLSAIVLSATFSLIIAYQANKVGLEYRGFPLSNILIVFFSFVVLYLLSRAELFVFVSYVFIAIFFILTTYTAFHWGADVPEALLGYAFIIVASGVLVGSRFAFGIAFATALAILAVTYFQLSGVTQPNVYWKPETLDIKDAIQFSVTFMVIAIVSWLSNREIERSLKRARKSEAELKEERDMLEMRVQERTRELEKAQMEKINQASRFIEFGKISSGLFHDLINHINFLFLNIEQATEGGEKELVEIREYLKQANDNKAAISEYIEDAKKQFQNQKIEALFSAKKEILGVAKILGYKLKTEKVDIKLCGDFDILTYGNAVRFNHVVTNIILNALDAYEMSNEEGKEIKIGLEKRGEKAVISIEDRAGGISEEIRNKIFDPFFTTKGPQKGAGIGLATAKNTVEEDFGGTIKVESIWGQGSKFIIEFPIRNEP